MRKILVVILVVLVGYLAISGNGRISSETTTDANAVVCGLAQLSRQAVHTTGDAVHATAGLVRDNTGGEVRDIAQQVVDTRTPTILGDRLDGWVGTSCG